MNNDFTSDYQQLLSISNKTTFLVRQHKNLAIEIFKTLKNLNPSYMNDIFVRSNTNSFSRRPNDLFRHHANGVTYGQNSLRFLGPKIWNSLPESVKDAQTLNIFKNLLSTWDGESCDCNMCRRIGK